MTCVAGGVCAVTCQKFQRPWLFNRNCLIMMGFNDDSK